MDRESEAVYLKQVNIFNGLNDEEIHDLISVAKRRTFRSGEVIFHRDDPDKCSILLKKAKSKSA